MKLEHCTSIITWLIWNTLVFEANDPIAVTFENLDGPNPINNLYICKSKEPNSSYVIIKSWCIAWTNVVSLIKAFHSYFSKKFIILNVIFVRNKDISIMLLFRSTFAISIPNHVPIPFYYSVGTWFDTIWEHTECQYTRR